jgi:hypothetical protein
MLAVQDLDASKASATINVDIESLSNLNYIQGKAFAIE